MSNKWTDLDLIQAVNSSTSFREVLPKLKLRYSGSNAKRIRSYCLNNNIDISHFVKHKLPNNKKPLQELLQSKITNSGNLRKRLLQEKVFEHKCMNCNLDKWLEKPIPLELHHVDGDRSNNLLNNLQLLCPNCHTLTDTYKGKNMLKLKRGRLPPC